MVAIGAHPDDIEFGCFGTLYGHYKHRDKIHEIILTDGELGGKPETRRREAEKAARLIDADVYFGSVRDGNVRDDHGTIKLIEGVLEKINADIVYTHSSNDRHQDHRYASLATVSAARGVEQVYEYESPSVVNTFSPNMYVDVTDGMKTKLAGLKCHASQKKRIYLADDAIAGLSTYRAFQASLHGRMAEAFQVARLVLRESPHTIIKE